MSQQHALKGLAFDVADLLAMQSWAGRNKVGMNIRLDHGGEHEEYEEVIAFRTEVGVCFLLMWRDQNGVVVQPMPGRPLRFASVSAALGRLYVHPGTPAVL